LAIVLPVPDGQQNSAARPTALRALAMVPRTPVVGDSGPSLGRTPFAQRLNRRQAQPVELAQRDLTHHARLVQPLGRLIDGGKDR
jgi:hypothetical protein